MEFQRRFGERIQVKERKICFNLLFILDQIHFFAMIYQSIKSFKLTSHSDYFLQSNSLAVRQHDLLKTVSTYDLSLDDPVSIIQISGSHVLAATQLKLFRFTSEDQYNQRQLIYQSKERIRYVASSQDYALIGTQDRFPILINLRTLNFSRSHVGHKAAIISCFFVQNTQYFGTLGTDGYLKIYKNLGGVIEALDSMVISKEIKQQSAIFCDSKKHLVAVPGMNQLQIVNLSSDNFSITKVMAIRHQKSIIGCRWMSDDKLVTASQDSSIKIWNFQKKILLKQFLSKQNIMDMQCTQRTINVLTTSQQVVEFEFDQKFQQELIDNSELKNKFMSDMQVQIVPQQQAEENQQEKQPPFQIKQYLSVVPQSILQVGETQLSRGRKFMVWNMMGTVSIRQSQLFQSIDVQFADINMHKNFSVDTTNCNVASLAFRGFAYASLSTQQHIGLLQYISVDGSKVRWKKQLSADQQIQSVAVGADFIVILNNKNCIKIYSHFGFLFQEIAFDRIAICIVAYQDQVAVFYQQALPIFSLQSQSIKIYRLQAYQLKFKQQTGVSITPGSFLKWAGYSQQGLLLTMDSKSVVRTLVNNSWQQIFRPGPKQKYYMIGMIDYQIQLVKVQDQTEPLVFPRPTPKNLKIRLKAQNFLSQNQDSPTNLDEYLADYLVVDHERERARKWGNLQLLRDQEDFLYRYIQNMKSQKQLLETERVISHKIIELVFESIQEIGSQKALDFIIRFVRNTKQLQKTAAVLRQSSMIKESKIIERHLACLPISKPNPGQYQIVNAVKQLLNEQKNKDSFPYSKFQMIRTNSDSLNIKPVQRTKTFQTKFSEVIQGQQSNPFVKKKEDLAKNERAIKGLINLKDSQVKKR